MSIEIVSAETNEVPLPDFYIEVGGATPDLALAFVEAVEKLVRKGLLDFDDTDQRFIIGGKHLADVKEQMTLPPDLEAMNFTVITIVWGRDVALAERIAKRIVDEVNKLGDPRFTPTSFLVTRTRLPDDHAARLADMSKSWKAN